MAISLRAERKGIERKRNKEELKCHDTHKCFRFSKEVNKFLITNE